jgi:hypothetical protein
MKHRVYEAIVKAVRAGKLIEPFTTEGFRLACPGLGEGTYNASLYKHGRGNPGSNSERFEKTCPGKFVCLRPFKYGL